MKQPHTYLKLQSLLVMFFLSWVCPSLAQDLKIVSFEQRSEPMTFPMQQRDLNGNICALVKVQLPTPGCKFEGNVIDYKFEVSEYWVYLSDGSHNLNIKCPGQATLFVNFAEYGISEVSSKGIYYLLLEGFGSVAVNQTDSAEVRRTSEGSVRQMKIIRDAVNELGAQHIGPFMNGIAPITKDGKVAFMDKAGNLLTAFAFDSYSDGSLTDNYWVVEKGGLKGVVNSQGRLIADYKYTYITGHNKLIALCDNVETYRNAIISDASKAKFDVIDSESGDLVAEGISYEAQYELLHDSSAQPRVKEASYFVDNEGQRLFKRKFEYAYPFSEDLACVETKKEGWIIIDKNGERMGSLPDGIVPYDGDNSGYADGCFHNGLLAVFSVESRKKGYANMFGELVIPCKYDVACSFSEGLAAVGMGSLRSGRLWSYINKTGEIVFNLAMKNVFSCGEFKNGIAIGELNGLRMGLGGYDPYPQILYNKFGEILLEGATFSLGSIVMYGENCFTYNLFPVEIRQAGVKCFGYINSDYELVIPYQFSAAEPFKDEFTSVTGEKGCGLLDSYGNVVWLKETESENLLEER